MVLPGERSWFGQGLSSIKLFLKWRKQTASSLQLRQKYYLQVTRKLAESTRGAGNKWENQHRFQVLVSYKYSNAYYCRYTHSQCMPHAHLYDLWTNTCGLVSRLGTCFSVMHVYSLIPRLVYGWVTHESGNEASMCNEIQQVWEGRQSIRISLKEFENVIAFWTAQNARMWSFIKMTTCPSSPSLLLQFFSFWRQANETTSAATVLRTIFLSTSGTDVWRLILAPP